ncbi:DUF6428 family protein [Planctomicrobium sp. SH668]|uniref:DUF6428 family protein n=1 Tax=Planctomicrobium sp. SH668 TaxID=3448126 RepID=UPI003F5BF882
MKLDDFMAALADTPNTGIQVILPDGNSVPAHFHVTEVGRVQKDFIDCGGTIRSVSSCVLQVWVAGDTDHRLSTTKLTKIIGLAAPLLSSLDLPVEVEYEAGVVSQYPLASVENSASGLLLRLGSKHTACLAEDRCGITPVGPNCCTTSNCC